MKNKDDYRFQNELELLEKGLRLDDRIFTYLQDYGSLDDELKMYVDYTYHPEPELWIQEEIQTSIRRSSGQKRRIFLFGEYGSGKKYQASAFCQAIGREMLVVRGSVLPDSAYDLAKLVRILKMENPEEQTILKMVNFMNRTSRVGHYFYGPAEEGQESLVQYRATVTGAAGEPFDAGVVADTILEMGMGYDLMKEMLLKECTK